MTIREYPNLTECLSTDVFPDASIGFPIRDDGWYLKHLDTGKSYHRVSGNWIDWGLGMSFAPPTKSGTVVTGTDGRAAIVFGSPFFDDLYSVVMTCYEKVGYTPVAVMLFKDKNGFTVLTINSRNNQPLPSTTLSWLCTRDTNE